MAVEKKSRREKILELATTVFAEKGFRQTDLQEVADLLGIGKGTIYRNFPSKKDLFLSAVKHGVERLQHEMNELLPTEDNPQTKLLSGIRKYLVFFEENPEVVELLVQERAEFKQRDKPIYFQMIEQDTGNWEILLENLLKETGTKQTLSTRSLLNILGNLVYGTMFTNFLRGRQQSLDEEIQDLMTFLLPSIFGVSLEQRPVGTSPTNERAETVVTTAPLLFAESGWKPLAIPGDGKAPSTQTGIYESDGIFARFFQREETPKLIGKVWFGQTTKGPSSRVRGGCIAAVLDEAMGIAAQTEGHIGEIASFSVEHHNKPTPESVAWLEAWVQGVEGKRVNLGSRLFLEDGALFAEAKAVLLK